MSALSGRRAGAEGAAGTPDTPRGIPGAHRGAEGVTPRTATAADQPCSLYAHTAAPVPLRTQYHHSRPVYLQNRVYGQIRYPADTWLCGTCHDSVHEVIDWLLGEGRRPNPAPGRKTLAEAQRTVDWYRTALAEKETTTP